MFSSIPQLQGMVLSLPRPLDRYPKITNSTGSKRIAQPSVSGRFPHRVVSYLPSPANHLNIDLSLSHIQVSSFRLSLASPSSHMPKPSRYRSMHGTSPTSMQVPSPITRYVDTLKSPSMAIYEHRNPMFKI